MGEDAMAGRTQEIDQQTRDDRRLREDLAACYRLAARNGWDDLIYTHITARLPGMPERYLINRFGYSFAEITASNLVTVDRTGAVVGDDAHPVSAAAFTLHHTIYRARSDVNCVIHLHTDAGIAVSALECGLLPLSQHALRFLHDAGYLAYEGLDLGPDEQERLAASLGRNKALFLRNHGVLTCGATIPEAYSLMHTLEKACTIQLRVMAASANLVVPTQDVAERTYAQLRDDDVPEGEREWPSLLRQLARDDPGYLD